MLVKMLCEDEELILFPHYEYASSFWLWAELNCEESPGKHRSLVITSVDGDKYNKKQPLMDFSSIHGQSTQTLYQPEVGRAKAIFPAVWSFCDWSKRLLRAQKSLHVHKCTQKLDILPKQGQGKQLVWTLWFKHRYLRKWESNKHILHEIRCFQWAEDLCVSWEGEEGGFRQKKKQ